MGEKDATSINVVANKLIDRYKIGEYNHRIITNDDIFQIQTKIDGEWRTNWRYDTDGDEDTNFSSKNKAAKWLRTEYGNRVEIQPAPWRIT